MKEVIGVRFRHNGKIYYLDPRDLEVELGTKVIAETARGIEFGWVVVPRKTIDDEKLQGPLKPIQRLATPEDIERYRNNEERSKKAFDICLQKIRERGLEMKLIAAEYAFDNNKIMFYFTADGRVDFRELVKDLAYQFHTRIELRQVGVRDEARLRGGIGMCGRELCCHSYLSDFIPVSIKMAKEQSLSLNPVKISGVCGRLMCCLKHEEDTYEYLNSLLPNVGDRVTAYDGVTGEVASVNVLRQRVKIYVTDAEGNKEIVEYKVEELGKGPRGRHIDLDDSSVDPRLRELEASEGNAGEEKEKEHRRNDRRRNRGDRGNREEREGRGGRENREEREGRGGRENREEREGRGRRDNHGNRENREEGGAKKNRQKNSGENRNQADGQKKAGFQKGGRPEGEKDPGQKNINRRNNRPNNRPRESRKKEQ